MPKRDRRSKKHDAETVRLMIIKENIDRPGLNLTAEDMTEGLFRDREENFARENIAKSFKQHLKDTYDP